MFTRKINKPFLRVLRSQNVPKFPAFALHYLIFLTLCTNNIFSKDKFYLQIQNRLVDKVTFYCNAFTYSVSNVTVMSIHVKKAA